MRQAHAQEEEARLEAEKRVKFKGTARIRLEHLYFPLDDGKELNEKNVNRLKAIFQQHGCRRLEVQHHVPAVIDERQLNDAIATAGVSPSKLVSPPTANGWPELVFPSRLECLHGRHRIQAGKEFLSTGDKWWTVDLYLADTNQELKTCLIEEYSNEQKPGEGEIYRKIRQYHFQRNLSFENRWWARLTSHGTRNLKSLLHRRELTAAFDALLDIPGLWGGMKISTLHKMIAMNCDEEILCYLDHIRTVLHKLFDGNQAALQKLDERTVKTVELTAPGTSMTDAETLRSQIRGGQIFGAFNDQEREHILAKLLLVDGVIPSLHTFFRDLQYLQACVDCVKRLISLSPGQTLFNAMECAFTGINQRDGQVTLQIAESEFVNRPGTVADQVNLGYQQIHAYAMRNFLDMPKELHGENLRAIPNKEADKGLLRKFAELAQGLGFESLEITMLKENPYSTTVAATYTPSKPVLVSSGNGEIKSKRCGLPRKKTYAEDSGYLYLNNIYDSGDEYGESITSFFVRRSVFFAFYGRHPWTNTNSGTYKSNLPQQMAYNQARGASNHREEDTNELLTSVGGRHDLAMVQYVPEQDVSHQERLEQERRTQARLSRERREQERQERLQQEWRRQERLEREWQEQQEQERQAQLERDRLQLERERLEQLERERQEQLERERQEQLERERQEQLERERQEQLERERQEQLERERQEQLEQERQEQLERERQEQLERERQEQLERERQEQLQRERKMQEEVERERRERAEREAQEQIEREREEEQERADQARVREAGNRGTQLGLDKLLTNSPYNTLVTSGHEGEGLQNKENEEPQGSSNEDVAPRQENTTGLTEPSQSTKEDLDTTKICIDFKIWERGDWRDVSNHLVDPSDPSEIERVAKKNMRKNIRTFDTNLRMLAPQDCFEAATAHGTNTILLIPEAKLNDINEIAASASSIRRELGRKREAVDEISERHHIRKKQAV